MVSAAILCIVVRVDTKICVSMYLCLCVVACVTRSARLCILFVGVCVRALAAVLIGLLY